MLLDKVEGLIESSVNLEFGACGFGWIGNAPMQCLRLAGKDRTGFSGGVIADGDDEVEGNIRHVIPRLALRLAGIDPMSL